MKKRFSKTVALMTAMTVALSGCGNAGDKEKGVQEHYIRILLKLSQDLYILECVNEFATVFL